MIIGSIVCLILWRYVSPQSFSLIFFRGLLVNVGYVIPIVIGLGILGYAQLFTGSPFWRGTCKGNEPRAIVYSAIGIVIASLGCAFVATWSEWKTAEENPFVKRGEAIQIGGFQPLLEKKINGFKIWNDSLDFHDVRRLGRATQEFQSEDAIRQALYKVDPWCYYPEISILELAKRREQLGAEVVAVAPQIKFSYRFPFFFVSNWTGVTLVYDDGDIEHLSAQEVQTDPRFEGKFAFPRSLSLKIVGSQIFDQDQGYLSGSYRRDDKPLVIHFPLRFKAENGRYYDVTATEPELATGINRPLYRLYYIDCLNGERSYYELDLNARLSGVRHGHGE